MSKISQHDVWGQVAAQIGNAPRKDAHLEWGLVVGRASPWVMYHGERIVRVVVHREDFAELGWESDLGWYRKVLTGKFEAKVQGRI